MGVIEVCFGREGGGGITDGQPLWFDGGHILAPTDILYTGGNITEGICQPLVANAAQDLLATTTLNQKHSLDGVITAELLVGGWITRLQSLQAQSEAALSALIRIIKAVEMAGNSGADLTGTSSLYAIQSVLGTITPELSFTGQPKATSIMGGTSAITGGFTAQPLKLVDSSGATIAELLTTAEGLVSRLVEVTGATSTTQAPATAIFSLIKLLKTTQEIAVVAQATPNTTQSLDGVSVPVVEGITTPTRVQPQSATSTGELTAQSDIIRVQSIAAQSTILASIAAALAWSIEMSGQAQALLGVTGGVDKVRVFRATTQAEADIQAKLIRVQQAVAELEGTLHAQWGRERYTTPVLQLELIERVVTLTEDLQVAIQVQQESFQINTGS